MLEGLEPPKNKTVYCKIDLMMQDLDEKDKQILTEALANPEWSASGLSTALRQRGLSVADTTITKHRQKACACYRD